MKRDRLDNGPCPRRCQVPAAPLHVQVDAVGHGPVAFDPVAPLGSPVLELHAGGEDVPAVLAVGQVGERGGQLDADLAVRRDADGLVAEAFARLAVGGEEPPFGFPPLAPLLGGELGGFEVVTVVDQAPAAAHDVHDTGLTLGAGHVQAVFQDRQTAGLVEPLAPTRYPPGARLVPFSPIGWDRRCISVRTPASSPWMWASWQRRDSAH